jgi:hypothetical protein
MKGLMKGYKQLTEIKRIPDWGIKKSRDDVKT